MCNIRSGNDNKKKTRKRKTNPNASCKYLFEEPIPYLTFTLFPIVNANNIIKIKNSENKKIVK